MLVQVNGESREISQEASLEELLTNLSIPRERVAIELNQKVIRRAEWANSILREGDKIEIVHFVGGG
ncbi:MAG TPA: sulfur carrier protein ThiS [Pyrinomonadaceae bacterium]|nr:sulfur carrier protein ThiS [Pyrinomonadaceae bacterium]